MSGPAHHEPCPRVIAGPLGGHARRSAIGPVVGIAFGMLGGCMWPLEIVPNTVRIALGPASAIHHRRLTN
jgi:hypothetical protein